MSSLMEKTSLYGELVIFIGILSFCASPQGFAVLLSIFDCASIT
jgi:hypothetical protein